ncbi:hypothetical protein EVAR_4082_1 [Eumeta japonica]|uniref:Uncharacterized protein n=1 Tax=Eumeta variegata TaxID=151549 RepID=A0A4C1T4U0_EUMVA|nr:hypothetical protein EVAR_4082_1 [Eumeta japonica]
MGQFYNKTKFPKDIQGTLVYDSNDRLSCIRKLMQNNTAPAGGGRRAAAPSRFAPPAPALYGTTDIITRNYGVLVRVKIATASNARNDRAPRSGLCYRSLASLAHH